MSTPIYHGKRAWLLVGCLCLCLLKQTTNAFVLRNARPPSISSSTTRFLTSSSSTNNNNGYSRQDENTSTATKKQPLYPKAGDVVRYYEMDGGRADGVVVVGKISFIQKQLGKTPEQDKWLVELTELENVGDGYYAEYSSRQRGRKKSLRPLEDVAPIAASFVRSEGAFKIPRTANEEPAVRAQQYDVEGYQGPFSGDNAIDKSVIEADCEVYNALKGELLRNAALAGVVGTLITNLVKGSQDAAIYAAGALAGVGYLFFLSIKTDTVGSQDQKIGGNVSNLRFVLPVLVVTGVALYNKSLGDANPTALSNNPFETITPEQYAAAVIGFLTYRLPLIVGQIKNALTDGSSDEMDDDLTLPGSAGLALKALTKSKDAGTTSALDATTIPVLLVSGPQAAGRTQLVRQLIEEGNGRFVEPKRFDAVSDGATFERLESRGEFVQVDSTGRYGVTRDGILTAGTGGESVVVVDADVELAKKLTKVSGARLIGVWVGLDSTDKFESRLKEEVVSGEIEIPADETEESVIRAKIREVVKDIEYGIVSGIFEFTILNDNPEQSIKELKSAADYCFDD